MALADLVCKIYSVVRGKNKIFVFQVLHSRINNETITLTKIGVFLDHAMKKVCQSVT